MKIPLFDIDGTLFKTENPIHLKAFEYVFKKIYGIVANQREINAEGMLDNQIIVEVAKLHGLNKEDIREKLKLALAEMSKFVKENIKNFSIIPLPGVTDLLSELRNQKIPLGILSGNIEDIAWAKLEAAGIKDFFEFGAFGDNAFKRVDLIEIAKKNVEKVLGKTFETTDFIIVGDTPKDIKCARDGGIKVIAVATGLYSFEDLEKENPDLLVKTLEEKEKIIKFLYN